jgi:hypothetical protein
MRVWLVSVALFADIAARVVVVAVLAARVSDGALVFVVVAFGVATTTSVVDFDLARSGNPHDRMGSAAGIVNTVGS